MSGAVGEASRNWLVGMAMVTGSGAVAGGLGWVASVGMALFGLG